MNKMRALFAATLLVLMTFVSPQVNSQKQDPRVQPSAALPGQSQFSLADGNGNLNIDHSNRLSCGPTSGSTFYVTGLFVTLKLSFGLQTDERIGEQTFGSWTVRSIFPAKGSRPETVTAYAFDGKFDRGTVGRSRPENPDAFNLAGRTNFSGLCTPPGRSDSTTRRYVRIYGFCGRNQEINFEVTDRPWHLDDQPAFYASGTFRGDVTCEVGNGAVNRLRRNLDRH